MIARSSAKIVPSDTGAGYFDNLPRYALPALQAAYDRVITRQYKTQAIHTGLKKDFAEIGVEEPTFAILNRWIEGVLSGHIERPLAPAEKSTPQAASVAAVRNSSAPATTGGERSDKTAEPVLFSVLTPADFRRTLKESPNALRDLVALAIDEKTADLQSDARRYASALISEHLREIADELEKRLRAPGMATLGLSVWQQSPSTRLVPL